MATPQDIPVDPSTSTYRSSLATTPTSSVPARHSASRHHSHSVSLGTFNPDHRVTRRKSINASAANKAENIRAAVLGMEEGNTRSSHRRSLPSKGNRNSRGLELASEGTKNGTYTYEETFANDDSAIADDMAPAEPAGAVSKARARRASEGSHLGGGKRASGELRCEKCGKGYKHSSCLTKHLWEHTPHWATTSKFLISKHQQVQLLEAASVLVTMNVDGPTEAEAAKPDSDNNSTASPAASGSSGLRDDEGYSSAETTPPPMNEQYGMADGVSTGKSKRYSGNSSSFSRSYQSAPSSSLPANGFAGLGAMYAQHSSQRRPSTSGLGPVADDEDDAGLVAAVSLCSFGTPNNRPVLLPADVPPVPPLPARFVEQSYQPSFATKDEPELSRQTTVVPEVRDVEMGNNSHEARAYLDHRYRQNHYDDAEESDDGVFGGMEGLAHEAHEALNFSPLPPRI